MQDEMPKYTPGVFDVHSLPEAKRIILTDEENTTTDERWERETPFLRDDIGAFFQPSSTSLLLDYGCGIGRLAKELIGRYACSVLGVDISQSMRILASGYVKQDGFAPVSTRLCEELVTKGLKVDGCYSVWVLQHCCDVKSDIELIRRILKQGGLLYILNLNTQAIPTDKGWTTFGVDVLELLKQNFRFIGISRLPEEATTKQIADCSYIAKFSNDL